MSVILHCPRCGSNDVRGEKSTFRIASEDRQVTVFEFTCRKCGLDEDREAYTKDFQEFYRRWYTDTDVEVD